MNGALRRLAELFVAARRPVVFTGAGVSTDSAIVNLEPTPLDPQANLVIREKAGTAMAAIVERVRARSQPAAAPAQRDRALEHHSVP